MTESIKYINFVHIICGELSRLFTISASDLKSCRRSGFKVNAFYHSNRPFPSCFEAHYESEATCKVFAMKISFHSYANKSNFHMKSFALSLAFIVRFTSNSEIAYLIATLLSIYQDLT